MSGSSKRKLTISLEVEAFSHTGYGILLDSLETSLSKSGYEDGRLPFDREMIQVGLTSLVKSAVEERVREFMRTKYGDGRNRATAIDEADKWMKTDFIGVFLDVGEWAVRVENWDDSQTP